MFTSLRVDRLQKIDISFVITPIASFGIKVSERLNNQLVCTQGKKTSEKVSSIDQSSLTSNRDFCDLSKTVNQTQESVEIRRVFQPR
jgi:hypothetical protein